MSYRSKPQQPRGFSRPNPWLHGAPPGMGGSGGMGVQGAQPFNNQLVNQLALANNLLTSALTKNQNVFGNQGTGLLGSAPVNFGMANAPLMQNMGLPMPQPKRMRMSNQGFNQRNRNNRQQNSKNRRDDRHDRLQRNNRPNKGKDGRNKRDERRKSDNADDSRDDDEKSYDPASPTSDGEKASGEESEENNQDSVRAGVKRARSPSPNSSKDKTKGASLQVTIQHGSKGRSVSKDGESGSGSASRGPLFCHVCKVSCMTQENFRRHMNGRGHKLRMDSLISLHEVKTKQLEASMKDYDHRAAEDSNRGRSRGGGGYCNICKIRFSGSAVAHKRTKSHKKKKEHLYPFCRKCRIKHFRNREEYEEHCQSEDHKKACEDWNRRRIESGSAGSDDDSFEDGFITYDELDDDDENESFADSKDDDKSNGLYSETPVGESFVVSLTCYYCNLCEKLYKKEELAKAHCQSKLHCEKYEKQLQEEEEAKRKEEEEESAEVAAKEEEGKEEELKETKEENEIKKELAEDEKSTKSLLEDIDDVLGDTVFEEKLDTAQEEEEEEKDTDKSSKKIVKSENGEEAEDKEETKATEEEVKEEPANSDNESEGGKVTRSSKSQESSPKRASLRGPKARCSRGRGKK